MRVQTLVTSQIVKERSQASTPDRFKFFCVRNVEDVQTGGADRDRTDDPLLAKQVLSQLSYSPEGLKGGCAALLDICRLLVWTPWNGEVVLERR